VLQFSKHIDGKQRHSHLPFLSMHTKTEMSTSTNKKFLAGAHAPRKPKKEVAGKKRGNRGNFEGDRLEFLEASESRYLTASSSGRGHITKFIDKFMGSYWIRFPWYDGLDAESNPLPKNQTQATIDLVRLLSMPPKDDPADELGLPGAADGATPATTAFSDVSSENVSPPLPEITGTSGDNAQHIEDRYEDPEWKRTGGVNPALKGAIQTDIKEVTRPKFLVMYTLTSDTEGETLVLAQKNRLKSQQQEPIFALAGGLSPAGESSQEVAAQQVLHAAGGVQRSCRNTIRGAMGDRRPGKEICVRLSLQDRARAPQR
jgi:hypothetical protein